jgi:hypothetical protein
MTYESGYLNNTGRQRMPKRFDRNGLKNLMKLGPPVKLQKMVDWSMLPARKMKC